MEMEFHPRLLNLSRLKSKLFTADERLGESPGELTKFIEYTGHNFDMQFLCILNGHSTIPDVEMFGKVLICHVDEGNETEQCSFNLIKKVVKINP